VVLETVPGSDSDAVGLEQSPANSEKGANMTRGLVTSTVAFTVPKPPS